MKKLRLLNEKLETYRLKQRTNSITEKLSTSLHVRLMFDEDPTALNINDENDELEMSKRTRKGPTTIALVLINPHIITSDNLATKCS